MVCVKSKQEWMNEMENTRCASYLRFALKIPEIFSEYFATHLSLNGLADESYCDEQI